MAIDPFVVNVARFRRNPGARWHEVRSGTFDPDGSLGPDSPVQSTVPPGAEAVCDVWLESFPGGVMVSGTVRAPWSGVCRRCALAVGGEITAEVRERYVAQGGAGPAGQHGANELSDDEAYPIVEDKLDLGPLVREAILLELPLAPLCRPDCRGLCPTCGVDRNEEDCHCVAPVDPRWAILSVLGSAPEGDPSPGHAREAT
jgi:uncharacterized protein